MVQKFNSYKAFQSLNDGDSPAHAFEKEIDSQHDVLECKKLCLTYNNHIVLATFGVRYVSRFVQDVLY